MVPIGVGLRIKLHEMSTEKRFLSGHALTWNTPYVVGNFIERIAPGALDYADMSDVMALHDHNPSRILGRSSSGTLTVKTDSTGLFFRVEVPPTGLGDEVATLVARGDLKQCSWGFSIAKDGDHWDYSPNGLPVRTITKIARVFDVTVTCYPANPKTSVAMDSATGIGGKRSDSEVMAAEIERGWMSLELLKAKRVLNAAQVHTWTQSVTI